MSEDVILQRVTTMWLPAWESYFVKMDLRWVNGGFTNCARLSVVCVMCHVRCIDSVEYEWISYHTSKVVSTDVR